MDRLVRSPFQRAFYGEIHHADIESCLVHDKVRMDVVCIDAVAPVVRTDKGIAHVTKNPFNRENIGRSFIIGSYGVMIHNDITARSSVFRQQYLSGKPTS